MIETARKIRTLATTLRWEALLANKDCTEQQARDQAARMIAAEQKRSPAPPINASQDGDARKILFGKLHAMAATMSGPPPAGSSLMERLSWGLYGTEQVNPAPTPTADVAVVEPPEAKQSTAAKIRAGVRAIAEKVGVQPAQEDQQPSTPLLYGGPVHSAQRIADQEYLPRWHSHVTENWRASIRLNEEIQRKNGRR